MLDKRRLAAPLKRHPWLARIIIQTYRLSRSRYTVGVIGVLMDVQGRVLLAEHVFHPRYPWGFPGGWVDRYEEPMDTIVREFREELNLEISIDRPLLIRKSQFWGSHLDIAYLVRCQTSLDAVQLSDEIVNWRWFALEDLPYLNQFNRMVADVLLEEKQSAINHAPTP